MPEPDALEFAQQLAPTTSNLSVNQIERSQLGGSLVLRPPFQRNLVWNDDQQSFLVDTILRGLPVPEIYTQYITTAEGDERITVVDGQQRLSTCLRFLADQLRLSGSSISDSARWRGKTFSELDADLRQRFRQYELVVRKLPGLSDDILREIFRRLNKTVEALLPQELRHAAYTGPFIQFVERAGAMPVLVDTGVFTAADYRRRRNDELIAEIAFAVSSNAYPNKKDGLDELFLTYERQGLPEDTLVPLERRFGRVFGLISQMVVAVRRTRFRNKSDFYSLFVYLARNAERVPTETEQVATLEARLREFSTLVNNIKRTEAEGGTWTRRVRFKREATSYLRAVERAASDRLNRVRRADALELVLGPLLVAGAGRPLDATDAAWAHGDVADQPEEEEEDSTNEDAGRTREVLLEAGGG